MNPNAQQLWPYPRWALAALLACLGTLGPFSIDTYLPAFTGIAASLAATPAQMQQTLSAYLFGFALMNLFHGALSDSFGRRPVVMGGLAVFTLASVGCALSPTIAWLVACRALQGMSAGAGVVVSRAVIRDMFPPADAQRVMSQVTIFFGIAPAVAPMLGGVLYVQLGWQSIFWLLALIGVALMVLNLKMLPETLHRSHRQSFMPRPLLRGYGQLLGNPRFLLLALASGVPFNGMFLYVLSAPEWLGTHLHLGPTQFFWFFALSISGIMGGAWLSGRLAGRIAPQRQIRHGFTVMVAVSLLNVLANALLSPHPAWALPLVAIFSFGWALMVPVVTLATWSSCFLRSSRLMVAVSLLNVLANALLSPHPAWALPLVAIFSFGWALMVPVVTLMVLDLVPDRRGMASSLQACVGSVANALVAGVVAPLVMHSTLALALASLAMLGVGLVSWLVVLRMRL